MAETHWLIEDTVTGEVLHADFITDGAHPRFHGWDWDPDRHICHYTDRAPDPAVDVIDRASWTWSPDPERLDALLHAKIDAEAGAFRLRFITDVPGQQLTYERKEREAFAWATATVPEIADFPFLAAEVTALGGNPSARPDVDDAAATIIAAAEQWAAIGSAIEGERIRAKRAVTAATTVQAKHAAAAVDWEGVLA
jgi:hypothetical protein